MEVFENLSASSRMPEPDLDAYSRAIRYVTEMLEPAVISIAASEGRGGGSGVVIERHCGPDSGAGVGGVPPPAVLPPGPGRGEGDVIVDLGESAVRSIDGLLGLLDEKAIGHDLELRVLRGGREVALRVHPAEAPEQS